MKLEDIRVGDRVRFRQWDDMAEEFGFEDEEGNRIDCLLTFTDAMRFLCGMTFTVSEVDYSSERIFFEEEFPDGRNWYISADMLEPDLPETELSDPFSDSDFSLFIAGGVAV